MGGWVSWTRLSFEEREEIAWRRDRKEGVREIARAIGRAPSTVSRELRRNLSPSPRRYRAFPAHIRVPTPQPTPAVNRSLSCSLTG